MGWVESPPYFCAATKTARDIASTYCDTNVGSLTPHKFIHLVTGEDVDFSALPITSVGSASNDLHYALEVYMDDFMSIVIPTSQQQLQHVATAVMTGIHDVFPANIVDANNPISEKKLLKGEGQYSTSKTLLGFDFDGRQKHCGWRRRSMPNSSRSYTVGSGRETSAGAYHSGILNPLWQSYDMHSSPFLEVGVSCPRATACSSYAHQWFTSIEMNPYDRHYQTAVRYYVNPPVVQHVAANW
jgi:hypothetical protein